MHKKGKFMEKCACVLTDLIDVHMNAYLCDYRRIQSRAIVSLYVTHVYRYSYVRVY